MFTQTASEHDYSLAKDTKYMTSPAGTSTGDQAGEEGGVVTIASRFGDVQVDLAKIITFPKGLLGMPDRFRFTLADFPTPNMQQFKLLQSLDEKALSFISLPLEVHNGLIAEQDILDTVSYLGIPLNEMAMLLIVSVHRSPEGARISVNARAPLFIDAARRMGIQHVFPHDKYKVQHMLG